jgi:2-iminobutanoate/2-iminopropanoate deaminase
MSNERINPNTVASTLQYGFSQAVLANSRGQVLYMSGQTAWDAERQMVGGRDVGQQARQAFENVRRLVESVGGSVADVVSLRIYVVGCLPEHTDVIGSALRASFPGPAVPATTWLGVSSLARPEFLVEVEAVAVLGVNQGLELSE